MVEWFMAAVLKTAAGQPAVGSNPTLSAIFSRGETAPVNRRQVIP